MSGSKTGAGRFGSSLISPSKWFWTVVPIALALAFVSGAFIAIDSSQMAVVRAEVDSIPVDFIGRGTTTDTLDNQFFIDTRIDYMSDFEGVEEVDPVVVMTYVLVRNSEGATAPYYTGGHFPVMFMPSESERTLESYKIEGDVPTPGTIALPRQMADDLDVTVGQTVSLAFVTSEYNPVTGNGSWTSEEYDASFQVEQIWTQDGLKDQVVFLPDGSSQQYLDVDARAVLIRQYLNPAVLNIDDLYPIVGALGYGLLREKYVDNAESLYLIWIDRGHYIDYADTERSVERLDTLYGPMSSQYLAYGVSVQRSDLIWVIGPWEVGDMNDYRLRYLGLSVPVLALGIYVTAVGAGIGADLRQDKLQSLASQGVRRRTILKKLTSESVIVGLIAGGVGLLLGIFVSRAVLRPIVAYVAWGSESAVSNSDYGLTLFTVLATLGLGVLVVFVASFFASVRATKPLRTGPSELDVLRALPITEVIMIGLSLVSVFAILGGQRWVGSHGFDWYFLSPGIFFDNIGLAIFPAVPFMLTLGIVSLLTRWPVNMQHRLAKSFSGQSQHVAIPLGPLAERCDKRARRMCVLVSLALALGLFITIAMDTASSKEGDNLGADTEATGLSQFLSAELVASMIVVLVGVTIASYANASMAMSAMVRAGATGAERRLARIALTSEAVALTVIGAVVGVSVGLFTAFLFGVMWVPSSGVSESSGIVLTSTVLSIAVVSFVLLVLSSVASSMRGSRYGLAQV